MRALRYCLSVLLLALALQSGAAFALEPLKVFRGALLLEGQFETGDYDKVRSFLSDKATFDKISEGVFLASPGGNVMEAIRIGYLFRSLKLNTLLPVMPSGRQASFSLISPSDLKKPKDFLCASACFLVYISGIDRNPKQVGRLGIHRPTLKGQGSGKHVQERRAIATTQMRNIIDYYVQQMGVSAKITELMFSVPPNKVHWLTNQEFSSFVRGQTPELTKALQQQCTAKAAPAADLAKCRRNTELALSARAWKKLIGGSSGNQ